MAAHPSVPAWRVPGTGSLVGCSPWGRKESDTTEVTQQQQQQQQRDRTLSAAEAPLHPNCTGERRASSLLSSECCLWSGSCLWRAGISRPDLPLGWGQGRQDFHSHQAARSQPSVSVETRWRVWTSNSTGNSLGIYPMWQ